MEKVSNVTQNCHKVFQVTRANGCLVVIPGSHKGPLLKHEYPKWEVCYQSLQIRDYFCIR